MPLSNDLPPAPEYFYRRDLKAHELLPAVGMGLGVGLGAGLVVFYLARMFIQRTPLDVRTTGRDPRSHRTGNG